MQISVKDNIKSVVKRLDSDAKKQIPFATAAAINNTAFITSH